MTPIAAGHLVAGRYELLRLLGRGSMGQVWVVHDRALGQNLALKLLSSALGGDTFEDGGTASARFRFEARIAARLSRKTRHIVSVTDYGEDEGVAFLAMELLEGKSLEQRLLQKGPMSPTEVAGAVAQIARALEQAHTDGVVHRDLKPANVFLTRDEDGAPLLKLLDFGIARATHRMRTVPIFATANGIVFGTPGYMSPEQFAALKVDVQCDLWALATVAYEALTGDLPVPGVETDELLANLAARKIIPVHERNPELPAGLAAFFERAFARQVEQRFTSATELAQAFQRAVEPSVTGEGASTSARPASQAWGGTLRLSPPGGPRVTSNRQAKWILASSAATLAALVVLGATWGVRARHEAPVVSLPAATRDQPVIPAVISLAPEAPRAGPTASESGEAAPAASPPAAQVHAIRTHPVVRPPERGTAPITTSSAGPMPLPVLSSPPPSATSSPPPPVPIDRSAVL